MRGALQRAASLGCPWNNLPRHRNPDTPAIDLGGLVDKTFALKDARESILVAIVEAVCQPSEGAGQL